MYTAPKNKKNVHQSILFSKQCYVHDVRYHTSKLKVFFYDWTIISLLNKRGLHLIWWYQTRADNIHKTWMLCVVKWYFWCRIDTSLKARHVSIWYFRIVDVLPCFLVTNENWQILIRFCKRISDVSSLLDDFNFKVTLSWFTYLKILFQ